MEAQSSAAQPGAPKFPRLSLAVCVVCAIAVVALFYSPLRGAILKIEPWSAEWRTVLLSDHTPAYPRMAVVIVTNTTLAGYAYRSPTPRDLLAKLIRAVDAAGPKAIGVDFYYVQATEASKDADFLDALHKAQAPVVLGSVDKRNTQFTEAELQFQKEFLSKAGKPAGYIDLQHDKDDVVRYTSPAADPDYPESIDLLLARTSVPADLPSPIRIAWLLGPGPNLDPFLTIPAEDLLAETESGRGDQLASQLKGKVVLISGEYPYLDRHRTPLSGWTGINMSGVKIHAQITAQLLDGRRYSELGALSSEALLVALAGLGLGLSWLFWHRRADFFGLGFATAVLIAIDAGVFYGLRTILPFTLALWAWFIGVTGGHHLRTIADWVSRRGE